MRRTVASVAPDGAGATSTMERPEPLHTEWAENVKKAGYDPKAVFEDLKNEIAKRNVAY